MAGPKDTKCTDCGRKFRGRDGLNAHHAAVHEGVPPGTRVATDAQTRPDWKRCCDVCGATPVVPLTGMCGPCTFGEADTAGGNW